LSVVTTKGFGEGYLNHDQFKLLGNVHFTGSESTVDSLLCRTGRRPVVRVYRGPGLLFALVDTYGVPRYLANEVANVVIYHLVSVLILALCIDMHIMS
jgi:hypothetical protein